MSKTKIDTYSMPELREKLEKSITIAKEKSDAKKHTKYQKIYIAGPWFDARADLLMKTTMEIVKECDRTSQYDVFFPISMQNTSPKAVYENNIHEIENADVVVAFISRKDVGTAYEIGYAQALNKRIVLVGVDEECFRSKTNIMLAFCTNECITIDKLPKLLHDDLSMPEDYVKIVDMWDGLE